MKIKQMVCIIFAIFLLAGCQQEKVDTSEKLKTTSSLSEETDVIVEENTYQFPSKEEIGDYKILGIYVNDNDKMEVMVQSDDKTDSKKVIITRCILEDGKWEYEQCTWKGDKKSFKKTYGTVVDKEENRIYLSYPIEKEEDENKLFWLDMESGEISTQKLKGFGEKPETTGENEPYVVGAWKNYVVVNYSDTYAAIYNIETESIVSEYLFGLYDCKIRDGKMYLYREGMLREYDIQTGKEITAYQFVEKQSQMEYITYEITEDGMIYVMCPNGLFETRIGEEKMEKVFDGKKERSLSDKDIYVFELYVNSKGALYTYSTNRKTADLNINETKIH